MRPRDLSRVRPPMRRLNQLVQALQQTLRHLEQEVGPDDPTLTKLKVCILQLIADFGTQTNVTLSKVLL